MLHANLGQILIAKNGFTSSGNGRKQKWLIINKQRLNNRKTRSFLFLLVVNRISPAKKSGRGNLDSVIGDIFCMNTHGLLAATQIANDGHRLFSIGLEFKMAFSQVSNLGRNFVCQS